MNLSSDIIRYNSLRNLADIAIDISGEEYIAAGVSFYPAGSRTFPPITGNPSRIFVKTDFLHHVLPHLQQIQKPFHLLTGTSDVLACPSPQFASWLRENTKIASWVGTNLEEHEPWMLCVPIGIEERGRLNREPEQLYRYNQNVVENSIDIYLPFLGETHPSRAVLVNDLLKLNHPRIFIETKRLPFQEYLRRLRGSRYTICPRGNGMDTLRIYEAALSGSMPIVQKTSIWRTHRDLGFLVFDNLQDIYNSPDYNTRGLIDFDKLKLSYQIDLIYRHQLRQFCHR